MPLPQAHITASRSTRCPPGSLGPSRQSCFPATQPQPLLVPGVIPLHVQHLAFLCSGRSCQPISPASGGLYQWQCNPLGSQTFSQLYIIYQLAESTLCPSVQVISEDAEQHQPHHPPLPHTARDQPSAGPHAADHSPLSLALQPVFRSPHCPFTRAALHQFGNEDDTGDSVKCFAEININSIHCPLLLHHVSDFIMEG